MYNSENTVEVLFDKLLFKVKYRPKSDLPGLIFEFNCCHLPKFINDGGQQNSDTQMWVFDIQAKKWINLDKDRILNISFPYFDDFAEFEQVPFVFNQAIFDNDSNFSVPQKEFRDRYLISPMGWGLVQNFKSKHFDYDGYLKKIEQVIESLDSKNEIWADSMISSRNLNWSLFLKDLNLTPEQVSREEVSLDFMKDSWLNIIKEVYQEALESLNQEAEESKEVDDQEALEEIELVKDLLSQAISEIDLSEIDSIQDVLLYWPQLLLPSSLHTKYKNS